MKMLVKIAAVLAICFILVEGRAHSLSLMKQLNQLRARESRTYDGHMSRLSGGSMLKKLPWVYDENDSDTETEADDVGDSNTEADGEDSSETQADEQDSEVETEDDAEEDQSEDNNDIRVIARRLQKALLNRNFYRMFSNGRRDALVTTPKTDSDKESSSTSESEAIARGLVKLEKKIDQMLSQTDSSGDDEETEEDDQESPDGVTDDDGEGEQESFNGVTEDTGASDKESSYGEEEEIERALLMELLARRLH